MVAVSAGADIYNTNLVLLLAFFSAGLCYHISGWMEQQGPHRRRSRRSRRPRRDGHVGSTGCRHLRRRLPDRTRNGVETSFFGQLVGVTAIFALSFVTGYGASWILKKMNLLRVPPEVELEGLDLAEYETDFYPRASPGQRGVHRPCRRLRGASRRHTQSGVRCPTDSRVSASWLQLVGAVATHVPAGRSRRVLGQAQAGRSSRRTGPSNGDKRQNTEHSRDLRRTEMDTFPYDSWELPPSRLPTAPPGTSPGVRVATPPRSVVLAVLGIAVSVISAILITSPRGQAAEGGTRPTASPTSTTRRTDHGSQQADPVPGASKTHSKGFEKFGHRSSASLCIIFTIIAIQAL